MNEAQATHRPKHTPKQRISQGSHLCGIFSVEGIEDEGEDDDIGVDKSIGQEGDEEEQLGLVAGHQHDLKGHHPDDCDPDSLADRPQVCDAVPIAIGCSVVRDEEADGTMNDCQSNGGPPESRNG